MTRASQRNMYLAGALMLMLAETILIVAAPLARQTSL